MAFSGQPKPNETNNFPASFTMAMKLVKETVDRRKKLDLKQIGQRPGDVVIITGGARGIGVDVVKKLLQCEFHVIMGIRKPSAGDALVAGFRQAGISTGTYECLPLDLKSLKSVREFGQMVLDKYPKIHILICHAAIMFTPYELTQDGFESQFQVDYLSHFLLTDLLLPRIIQTANGSTYAGRIVNVSSAANWSGQIKNLNEIETRATEYNRFQAYFDAKLCQVAASNYLDRKVRENGINVYVYSLHPGAIVTELGDNFLTNSVNPPNFLKKMLRTTEDGADVIVCAAASPEFEKRGGIFLMNCKVETPNSQSCDEILQRNLWKHSCRLLKIDDKY